MSARRVAGRSASLPALKKNVWSALSGLCSALVVLAVAELVAVFVAAPSSPLFAVGAFLIDIVPGWLKEFVISLFGTGDKAALLVTLGVLVAVLAAIVGILELRRPPWGTVLLGVIAVAAAAAALSRTGATPLWALPTAVGTVAGIVVLRALVARLRGSLPTGDDTAVVTRRGFLSVLVGSAVAAVVVGVGSRAISIALATVNTMRANLRLPRAEIAAPPIPAGADLGIAGVASLVTSNADFYRIDTALQVPSIDASRWTLKVTGMVDRELEIGFDELLAIPLTETVMTMTCVSNYVGGNLVGNATWLGYPIRELLATAGPKAGADMVLSKSVDGFTASTPLDVLLQPDRDSLLAVGMNGEPLPLEHGFPVRMIVPGLYGYVSATKWLVELEVTRFADATAYWTKQGWAPKAPVKVSSRVDVPVYLAEIPEGKNAIAGVAWAQHRGITAVEIRIDRVEWVPATLADAISIDTWRQWVYEWDAPKGAHLIEVRATDADGTTQTNDRKDSFPDGAEGWHQITVQVV
jgi:DMSO/TMAO reductase YedYZ molybdopterin-dependent catalytic subunit